MEGTINPEDHTHWTTAQWRARCHLWRGEPSWRCLTWFTKDHALFLGLTSVLVLIVVFIKDVWADYHPEARNTMTEGRAHRPAAAERPSTPRSRADDTARVKGSIRKVGSGLLPALFQAKKE